MAMIGHPDDPYMVLGLHHGATPEDIRQAYFRIVRLHTPEAHPEEFKRIRTAYETLRSPQLRAEVALLRFDQSVVDVDLDLVARVTGGEVDLVSIALAAELAESDFVRTEFADDLTPLRAEDLLDA
jgi:curved DNA-binding protein CbpA